MGQTGLWWRITNVRAKRNFLIKLKEKTMIKKIIQKDGSVSYDVVKNVEESKNVSVKQINTEIEGLKKKIAELEELREQLKTPDEVVKL